MRFSTQNFRAGQVLLRVIETDDIRGSQVDTAIKKFRIANPASIMEMARQCRWVSVSQEGVLLLTERGKSILAAGETDSCLREQLADVISAVDPPWARKITLGRYEACKAMPDDVERCFRECSLLDGIGDEVVHWWDAIGFRMRSNKAAVMHKIGRVAEKSTLVFEKERVVSNPTWQSIESSVSGYDVLSVVDKSDQRKLKVEVKGSSMRLSEAIFSLTRNEWQTASTSDYYYFHLWLLDDTQPKLYIVPQSGLEPFVPEDRKTGRWQTAQMYFRDFKEFHQPLAGSLVSFVKNQIELASRPSP